MDHTNPAHTSAKDFGIEEVLASILERKDLPVLNQYDRAREIIDHRVHNATMNDKRLLYCGAGRDLLLPLRIGGRWKLIDNYSEDKSEHLTLMHALGPGSKAVHAASAEDFEKIMRCGHCDTQLIVFRKSREAYVNDVCGALLASACYALTDMALPKPWTAVARTGKLPEVRPIEAEYYDPEKIKLVKLYLPVAQELVLYCKEQA